MIVLGLQLNVMLLEKKGKFNAEILYTRFYWGGYVLAYIGGISYFTIYMLKEVKNMGDQRN